MGGRSGGKGWSWVLLGEFFDAIARVRGETRVKGSGADQEGSWMWWGIGIWRLV